MSDTAARILIVSDDDNNIEQLTHCLQGASYTVDSASGLEQAWNQLTNTKYSLAIVERSFAGGQGLDFLQQVHTEPALSGTPVIMQLAATDEMSVSQVFNAGALFYLSKPANAGLLINLVDALVQNLDCYAFLRERAAATVSSAKQLLSGEFRVRTMTECRELAAFLASLCPNPDKAIIGLTELLINAIEHGNLEISYEDKTHLLREGRWLAEIESRLQKSPYHTRYVEVLFRRTEGKILITIADQGEGFDWTPYQDIQETNLTEVHGRGIIMAKFLSFDKLIYEGRGNRVVCEIELK